MKLGVLGQTTGWHLQDLCRAAGEVHQLVPLRYTLLQSAVGSGETSVRSGETDLATLDALLVRAMPPGSLEQVVFRMDTLARLEAAGVAVVNRPKAIEASVDKYLATARLQAAGLRVPETACCQNAEEALEAFSQFGGDVVVKPIFGSEGRGITRVDCEAVALRVFRALEQTGAVLYLQRFIPHEGRDLRLLVIGERVLGIERSNPSDWRTNASRGAACRQIEVTSELGDLATRAASAVGATIAGVDILPAEDGTRYALEVNACPGWRALSAATGADVAGLIVNHLAGAAVCPAS